MTTKEKITHASSENRKVKCIEDDGLFLWKCYFIVFCENFEKKLV